MTHPAEQPRPNLDRLLQDIQALEMLTADWEERYSETLSALRTAVDDLHREAFARLIRRLREDPASLAILKQAMGDEVIYAVFRHLGLIKPSIQERLHNALESVRPYLHSHGGDVELVAYQPPDQVSIRLVGTCDGCPASSLTLSAGVKKAIREHCPEITQIRQAKAGLMAKPVREANAMQGVMPS